MSASVPLRCSVWATIDPLIGVEMLTDGGWAAVVVETAPGPGASFSELLSWTLDLAESSDLLSEWEHTRFRKAVAEHLARLTGDEAEKLTDVLGYLFAIAHRRAPADRKALGRHVRREGRYRVSTRFLRIAS